MINDQSYAGEDESFFMYAAWPVIKRRNEKNSQQDDIFFVWENVNHNPVKRHRSEKRNKSIENDIDIILPKTKYVKNGNDFGEYVCFQVIPIRIFGTKKAINTFFCVRIVK